MTSTRSAPVYQTLAQSAGQHAARHRSLFQQQRRALSSAFCPTSALMPADFTLAALLPAWLKVWRISAWATSAGGPTQTIRIFQTKDVSDAQSGFFKQKFPCGIKEIGEIYLRAGLVHLGSGTLPPYCAGHGIKMTGNYNSTGNQPAKNKRPLFWCLHNRRFSKSLNYRLDVSVEFYRNVKGNRKRIFLKFTGS